MKYYTHNSKQDINPMGTHFISDFDITYNELVDILGEPTLGDDYKCDAEWYIEFEDGVIITIYNYKNGKNYLGEEGLFKENITDWHIGGSKESDKEYLKYIFKNM